MDLVKSKWTSKDILAFNKYLVSLSNEKKIPWTTKIVNTKMKVLAIPNPVLKKIAREIKKGNFLSYLDLENNPYYENTIITAYLLPEIKDYNTFSSYLNRHLKYLDNWSSVDTIKFNIQNEEEKYFKLAKTYLKSKDIFTRRLGIIILFNFPKSYYKEIYKLINESTKEEAYYVNMAYAWLICELFIRDYENTLEFFKNSNLSKFVHNKAISKCTDSYRLTNEEKNTLKELKIK